MKTITICQRKGGNGKSTSCLNLAHAFALEGKKVLVIDLDDQKNTTSAIATDRITHTIDEVLLREEVSMKEAVVKTTWEGVSIAAGSTALSGAIRELDSEVGGHLVLKEELELVSSDYDYCLIDTSPSLNILVVNALCASEYVFIPLSSKYFSLQGLGQTLESVAKVQKRLHKGLRILGIAFVLYDGRSRLSREVVEKARGTYPEYVMENLIHQNIKIEEAQVSKQSIFSYASVDRGAGEYKKLAQEVLSRIEQGEKE